MSPAGGRGGFSGYPKQKGYGPLPGQESATSRSNRSKDAWEEWIGPIQKELHLKAWFFLLPTGKEQVQEAFKQELKHLPVFKEREVFHKEKFSKWIEESKETVY